MDAEHPLPRHQMAFLREGQSWQLFWEDGDESLLIETVAALVADPSCPLDHYDQTIIEQQLCPSTHGKT